MFAILARLQVAAVGDASFAGGATGGFVNTSDEGSQALSSALSAASGGGSLGMSDSAFASKLIISPELIAREKSKAKQGFCETALWNCTDLCELPHDCFRAACLNVSNSGVGQHAPLFALRSMLPEDAALGRSFHRLRAACCHSRADHGAVLFCQLLSV